MKKITLRFGVVIWIIMSAVLLGGFVLTHDVGSIFAWTITAVLMVVDTFYFPFLRLLGLIITGPPICAYVENDEPKEETDVKGD